MDCWFHHAWDQGYIRLLPIISLTEHQNHLDVEVRMGRQDIIWPWTSVPRNPQLQNCLHEDSPERLAEFRIFRFTSVDANSYPLPSTRSLMCRYELYHVLQSFSGISKETRYTVPVPPVYGPGRAPTIITALSGELEPHTLSTGGTAIQITGLKDHQSNSMPSKRCCANGELQM